MCSHAHNITIEGPVRDKTPSAPPPPGADADCFGVGVPLGIEVEIPTRSVFLTIVDNDQPLDVPCASEIVTTGAANYISIYDNWEDAQVKLDRYVAAGYGRVVPGQTVIERYGDGSISKMAIILNSIHRQVILMHAFEMTVRTDNNAYICDIL